MEVVVVVVPDWLDHTILSIWWVAAIWAPVCVSGPERRPEFRHRRAWKGWWDDNLPMLHFPAEILLSGVAAMLVLVYARVVIELPQDSGILLDVLEGL